MNDPVPLPVDAALVATPAAIDAMARRHPTSPAIILDDRTMTFAELAAAIDGMAAAFLARGIAPGAAVGLVIADSPIHLLAFLALFRLGVRVLPLGPDDPLARRRGLFERVGVRWCVGQGQDALAGDDTPFVDLDALRGAGDRRRLPPSPPIEATAYFARSSGTTGGVPKLVEITYATMAARDARVVRVYPYGPGDRYLRVSTISGSHGRYHARLALVHGAAVIFASDVRTPLAMHQAAVRHQATSTTLTPPAIRDLLRIGGPMPLFPGMRLTVGTAMLTAPERRATIERLTPLLHIAYATSEFGGISMATPSDMRADIETLGRPYHDIVAEAVDDQLRPLPANTVGTLRYRGPEIASGYVDEVPGATSRFHDGWFYPGDAGLIDAEGRIRLLGRTDDFLNIGGQKIHPADIERVMAAHPAIEEVVAIPMPTAREGEVPIVAIIARGPVDEAGLLAFGAAGLSPRVRPRRAILLDAFPRNATGKVDRRALIAQMRETLRDGQAQVSANPS